MLDFSLSVLVRNALLAGVLMPLYLAVVARIPAFYGRNALQFAIAFCIMAAFWGGFALWIKADCDWVEVATSLMILGCAALFYLEVWALLSRGYTLGLLLTLYRAKNPLTETDLAASYRGGEGVAWIMKHRLSGLKAAGLVKIFDQQIVLTPFLGVSVAVLYKLILAALGLRKTG